ncbi:hypothetical protein BMR99_10015 [Propionibacterium freudenreichii]|uniref:Uncharacterized protein n=1 Tax=Propionibacterium freudenreichii subsp. shermanii (strain ATCC 9614 / DSM 4902 / CIP 103027 / NCIMB 8099 / CIRM-BIA1) TaxID=754252 RepID=D7GGH6_PROFC|nr:hypothetical protein BMR99_10015 [Propionibacterium freudenreichii]CBL57637.1 Hypothetical protein PFREUD_21350 [Propionibacterium freudenreichii subsp. shermanii CIRM-BIA1]CUW09514.1 conserved protein [Propionibacterium freudenreichii subsp. shermanii]
MLAIVLRRVGLGAVGPRVTDFVDQEPVESFDLPVVARPGALVACREHGGGEVAGPVVRIVVGDDPHDRGAIAWAAKWSRARWRNPIVVAAVSPPNDSV